MRRPLEARSLTYEDVGGTRPDVAAWAPPAGYRPYEQTVRLGDADRWDVVSAALLAWEVKTRSGFAIEPPGPVVAGHRYWLLAHLGPVTVREPAQVVAVVEAEDRCAFAYGTLQGHPVTGEEAFIVHRDDGGVWLTLRSLTRPGGGRWRVLFPFVRVAQLVYRRRYLRALAPT